MLTRTTAHPAIREQVMRYMAVILLLLSLLGLGQTSHGQTVDPQCIGPEEKVYSPGTDKVQPPRWSSEKITDPELKKLKIRAEAEVLINGKGRVCQILIRRIDDRSNAEKIAKIINEYWHFTPAMLDGKAVAVRVLINFRVGYE